MRARRRQYKYFIVFSLALVFVANCQPRGTASDDKGVIEYDDTSGPILLRVVDARSSAPLANAAITLAAITLAAFALPAFALPAFADDGGPRYTAANADGYALFPDVAAGPQVLRIRHPGYEPGFARLHVAPRSTRVHTIRLLPAKIKRLDEPRVASKITEEKYEIKIPANAFTGPADQPVRLRYTMAEPTVEGIRSMPGSFRGIPASDSSRNDATKATARESRNDGTLNSNSETVANDPGIPLESFGAIAITAYRGEREVNLAPNKKIHVRFACGDACQNGTPPASVPLWSLDESTGLWREEGAAQVVRENESYWIEAELPHLSWWNVDRPLWQKSALVLRGFVDERGRKLREASAHVEGVDRLFHISSFALQDQDAMELCLEVPPHTRVRVKALAWHGSIPYEGQTVLTTGAPGRDCREYRRGAMAVDALVLKRSPESERIARVSGQTLISRFGRLEELNLRDGSRVFGSITAQRGNLLFVQSLQGRLRLPTNSVEYITYP